MAVRLLDELTDLEKLALIPVSYSRLDTYFNASFGCKAKYFYQYIVKEPRGFGSAALLGNVVHQVLENCLESNMQITDELMAQFENEFATAHQELDVDSIITQDQINTGINMLQEFVDRHSGERLGEIHKELPFEIVIGSALIRGFIDRVDIGTHRVSIRDYKSGSYEVAKKDVSRNLQLGLYASAASKLFPDKEIYAELYYLKSGRQKGHLFEPDDLQAIESNLTSLVSELLVRQNYEPTPNPRACYGCDYASNGVCPIGAKRVRR